VTVARVAERGPAPNANICVALSSFIARIADDAVGTPSRSASRRALAPARVSVTPWDGNDSPEWI
jgi:hypothetical protein